MQVCYVDESGDTATLTGARVDIQPLFAILGLSLPAQELVSITNQFLLMKETYFPSRARSPGHRLEELLRELKGAEIRKVFRTGNRNIRRHHVGFLDRIFDLLDVAKARVFGRVFIKAIGFPNDAAAIYTSSMQAICASFEALLAANREDGFIIADSRQKPQNANMSFSIFTRKFKATGDPYPHLVEMPTFGHSENHAGLQLVDALVSAIVFPVAAFAFCSGHVQNVHVHPNYLRLRQRYGPRLRSLVAQPGDLVVSDPVGKKGVNNLFA